MIRIIVTELSGQISGTVVDVADYAQTDALVVYSYIEGMYEASEEGVEFVNSVSSSDVNMTDGSYTLSFLEEGSYTLVTAQYTDSTFVKVVDEEPNVEVNMGETTTQDLNTSD